tara:strand:+ start:154 stop:447 length:294 start_codon:yes stop_codon:yes gene_type:complete
MLFILPRPLVFKHAIAQPWEAQAQTLYPLKLEGAKCMPCVKYPNFSPFTIFALPLVNIFIYISFLPLGVIASLETHHTIEKIHFKKKSVFFVKYFEL